MIKIDEIELELLNIMQPEDRVLFRVDEKMSVDSLRVLREQITEHLGPIKFLIICPGISAHLLRQLNRDGEPGDFRAKRRGTTESSGRADSTAGEADQDQWSAGEQDQDHRSGALQ